MVNKMYLLVVKVHYGLDNNSTKLETVELKKIARW